MFDSCLIFFGCKRPPAQVAPAPAVVATVNVNVAFTAIQNAQQAVPQQQAPTVAAAQPLPAPAQQLPVNPQPQVVNPHIIAIAQGQGLARVAPHHPAAILPPQYVYSAPQDPPHLVAAAAIAALARGPLPISAPVRSRRPGINEALGDFMGASFAESQKRQPKVSSRPHFTQLPLSELFPDLIPDRASANHPQPYPAGHNQSAAAIPASPAQQQQLPNQAQSAAIPLLLSPAQQPVLNQQRAQDVKVQNHRGLPPMERIPQLFYHVPAVGHAAAAASQLQAVPPRRLVMPPLELPPPEIPVQPLPRNYSRSCNMRGGRRQIIVIRKDDPKPRILDILNPNLKDDDDT